MTPQSHPRGTGKGNLALKGVSIGRHSHEDKKNPEMMINYGLIRCVMYQSPRAGLRNARRTDVKPLEHALLQGHGSL
jgi:hypothetical protein